MTNSSLSMGLAFASGIVTILSPCILPVLPIIIGRSLQSHRYGPIALVSGLVAGFAVTGSLLGFAASWIPEAIDALRYITIVVLLCLGILSIFPQLWHRIFRVFSFRSHPKPIDSIGLGGEFLLGTQLGLLWTPCAGPILASILLLAAVHHQPFSAFGLLTIYGLGAGIPMLMLAYGGRYFSQKLLKLRARSGAIQRLVIKIFHGLMIISLFLMMCSGLQIYNANPVFGSRGGWNFPSFVTLGGWLAGGRNWHFATMWIFSFNLLIYGIYIGLTKRWQKRFVSSSDLQVLKTGQNPKRKAYAWHRLLYTGIIPVLLLSIASGLAMYKPIQLAWLANLFGSWQTLRIIHFLTVPIAILFTLAHIFMGLKVGGMRIIRSMFV